MNTPLLPPWATDDDITDATDSITWEILLHHERISQAVTELAPGLVNEASAYLQHITEGW